MTKRDSHFAALLDAFLREWEAVPFDWRGAHCMAFCADWLERATGSAPTAMRTSGVMACQRELKRRGGYLQALTGELGAPIAGRMAQLGDVVLVRLPRVRGRATHALGVCVGAQVVAPGFGGLTAVPVTEAEAAWRI